MLTGRKSARHPKARHYGYGEALLCRIGVMRGRVKNLKAELGLVEKHASASAFKGGLGGARRRLIPNSPTLYGGPSQATAAGIPIPMI
jgi:hypothetical protein